jgi:hypothetical protein
MKRSILVPPFLSAAFLEAGFPQQCGNEKGESLYCMVFIV